MPHTHTVTHTRARARAKHAIAVSHIGPPSYFVPGTRAATQTRTLRADNIRSVLTAFSISLDLYLLVALSARCSCDLFAHCELAPAFSGII
jgi:hypothetical protein